LATIARIDAPLRPGQYRPSVVIPWPVWNFIKRRALYGRYNPTFTEFRGAIAETETLDRLPTTHVERLKALITVNSQQLEDVSVMAA